MRRVGLLALMGLALLPAITLAQAPIGKNVDAREVLRRGNLVEHVTADAEDYDPSVQTIAQIASTPDSDADKWYISVIGQKGCVPCKKLMEDWKTDQTLRAYAVPESAKDSWAHFTYYDYDDPLQSWRWKKSDKNPNPIKITAFPTLIVQPPRSGKYGKPSTIVLKYVYEGSPEKLHTAINGSIKQYVQKLERRAIQADESPLIGGYRAKETAADFEKPIGQQQVPPLPALPLDTPAPVVAPDAPATPVRSGLIAAFGPATEIVVLKDSEQQLTHAQERQIEQQVEALQPSNGRKFRVLNRDVAKHGQQYGVSPDEAPVVLQMEGKRVAQKVSARLPTGEDHDESERGFVVSGVLMLLSGVMGYGTALMIGKLLNFVFWVVLLLVGLLVLVMVVAMLRPRAQAPVIYQQPAPSPVPAPAPAALTPAQIAEIAAAVAAAQAKPSVS